jgi:CBS domain-containing protein
MVTVRQVMTPAPDWIRDEGTVSAAARRLRELEVGSLPVCGEGGRFLGMLSSRDIVDRCVAFGLDPMEVRVGSLMNGDDLWIDPDHPADDAVLAILFLHADGLPVVQDGQLVGLVGLVDVAAHP